MIRNGGIDIASLNIVDFALFGLVRALEMPRDVHPRFCIRVKSAPRQASVCDRSNRPPKMEKEGNQKKPYAINKRDSRRERRVPSSASLVSAPLPHLTRPDTCRRTPKPLHVSGGRNSAALLTATFPTWAPRSPTTISSPPMISESSYWSRVNRRRRLSFAAREKYLAEVSRRQSVSPSCGARGYGYIATLSSRLRAYSLNARPR